MPSALPMWVLGLCQEGDKDPAGYPAGVRACTEEPSWEMFAVTPKMAGLAHEVSCIIAFCWVPVVMVVVMVARRWEV